jgi:thioredoxin-like negative regulator of GroEL
VAGTESDVTRTFSTEDEAAFEAFLAATPRALVLFRGTRCPYSATFRPHFEKAAGAHPAWTFAVRDIEEGDDATWDAHGIEVTPTVVASVEGRPVARLRGKLLLGITRQAFANWLKRLP